MPSLLYMRCETGNGTLSSGVEPVGTCRQSRPGPPAVGDDLIEAQARLRAVFVHLALEAARAGRRIGLEDRERGRVERDALGAVEREVGQQALDGNAPGQVLDFRQRFVLDGRRDVVGWIVGDPDVVPAVLRLWQERRLRDGDDAWRRRDERAVLVDPEMQRIEFAAAAGNAWWQRMAARVAKPAQRDLHAARPVRVLERAEGQIDLQAEAIARDGGALRRLAAVRRVFWSHPALPEQRRRAGRARRASAHAAISNRRRRPPLQTIRFLPTPIARPPEGQPASAPIPHGAPKPSVFRERLTSTNPFVARPSAESTDEVAAEGLNRA